MRYRTLFVAGALCAAVATQASAQAARFEVTSLKAVRPTITKLIADLEKKDAAAGTKK